MHTVDHVVVVIEENSYRENLIVKCCPSSCCSRILSLVASVDVVSNKDIYIYSRSNTQGTAC